MENRYVAARRAALWGILLSKRTDKEKLDEIAAFGDAERRRAYGRGYWDARRASAVGAGKIRRVEGGKA